MKTTKFSELREKALKDPETAVEYYKALAEGRTWRYDEPPKDGTLILGYFLPMDPELDRWAELGGVNLTCMDPEGNDWLCGTAAHSDCRLLCWQPIDWEV